MFLLKKLPFFDGVTSRSFLVKSFIYVLVSATVGAAAVHGQGSSPAPAVQPPNVPAPTAPQQLKPNLAPEGVFYLIGRVAVKTAYGVTGFAPGTRVKLIKDHGDTILVSNEGRKFEVPSDKLTNDLGLAALAARQDGQSQQALEEAMRQRLAVYRAEKEQENRIYKQQPRYVVEGRGVAPASTLGKWDNPLDRGAYHEKQSVPWWWRPYMYYRHR